jgi:hypothetical protein
MPIPPIVVRVERRRMAVEALTAASNQVAGAGEQVGIELTKFAALVCESACLRRTSCPLFGSLSQMFIILYNPQHRFLGLRVGQ